MQFYAEIGRFYAFFAVQNVSKTQSKIVQNGLKTVQNGFKTVQNARFLPPFFEAKKGGIGKCGDYVNFLRKLKTQFCPNSSKFPPFLKQFPHFFFVFGGQKRGKSGKTGFQFGQGDFAKGLVKGHFSKKRDFSTVQNPPNPFFFLK